MSLLSIISSIGGTFAPASDPGGGSDTYYTALIDGAVVADNDWYEGYDFPFQYTDGSLIGAYRRSASHISDGPIIFRRSADGGASFTHTQIEVDGTPITGQALTFGVIPSGTYAGRQIIGWNAYAATNVNLAYRDGLTGTFTSCGTINAAANTSMNFSTAPIRMMPDGTMRFGVYILPTTGTAYSTARFINGSADGTTWALGDILRTHATQATTAPIDDWMFNEWDWLCTEDTGVNATSKFIAVFRTAMPSDGGTYYIQARSIGGTTWTIDTTEDAGSFVNDNGATITGPFSRALIYRFLPTNSPPSLSMFNGLVHMAVGERNITYGYAQKYITASPAGAYTNIWNNWTAPVDVYTFNDIGGATIDVGYGVLWQARETEAGPLKLLANPYEMSPLASGGNSDKRTRIVQLLIKPTRHTGIFVPNTNQVLYYGTAADFNALEGVAEGDEVEIPAGTYDYFEAHIIKNVKFVVTGGQAIFNSFSCKVGSQNIEIDGVSESGVPYGIKTIGSTAFAGLFQTVGRLTIKGWNSDGNAMGIQVSHNPVETYALNYCRLIIEDCRMENTGTEGEGLYIGHDTLSLEVLIDARIRYNQIENCGRDGIQFRNGFALIHNNSIINVGTGGNTAHAHGILIGGNTDGSFVYDNTGSQIAGNAIFANGFGEIVFENNTLSCTGVDPLYGVYTKNYESDTADLQSVGLQKFYFINNNINPINSNYSLVMAEDVAKCPVSYYSSGNNWNSKPNFIDGGIAVLGSADYTPFVETWAYEYEV